MSKTGAAVRSFGRLADGREVEAVTLSNRNGVTATVLTYGAALQSLWMPDRDGWTANVQPGHESLEAYLADDSRAGVTIGRYANRISNGRFALDGVVYQLAQNDGANALHGGPDGFDQRLWDIVERTARSVTLQLVSPDGDQGYPGTLTVLAAWSLDEANCLSVDYRATSDAPTVVNITHHGYWALGGDALAQRLESPSASYVPIDAAQLPLGDVRGVEGTPFDFRTAAVIADRLMHLDEQLTAGRGFNHHFVVQQQASRQPIRLARLADPVSGRAVEFWSNQPGFQLYTGRRNAVAIEAQRPPDTPNHPRFGNAGLKPGERYRNHIEYRLSWDEEA